MNRDRSLLVLTSNCLWLQKVCKLFGKPPFSHKYVKKSSGQIYLAIAPHHSRITQGQTTPDPQKSHWSPLWVRDLASWHCSLLILGQWNWHTTWELMKGGCFCITSAWFHSHLVWRCFFSHSARLKWVWHVKQSYSSPLTSRPKLGLTLLASLPLPLWRALSRGLLSLQMAATQTPFRLP